VLEPSAVALLGASASVVLGLGMIEASMQCAEMPLIQSMQCAAFAVRYAVENLLPSCLWATQDANLIATAMGYDPQVLLQSFDPTNAADASTLLRIELFKTSRGMAAGFMLIAQLVRAGTIGAAAPGIYEARVRKGREPPIVPKQGGLIIRMCGIESDATATSLKRMRHHLLPVFEDPIVVAPIVSEHSDHRRLPVFWCVRPESYGMKHSWDGFPVSSECFIQTRAREHVLILEADATNSNDPLALGDQALDLTIDDASQGFRRIQDLYESSEIHSSFRLLRVYLGNSLEISKSGGGHAYTLRHRIRYAKEVDVLIDSRAPVLKEILHWCDIVTTSEDRRILFQTSNRQYFLNLQLLMRKYGYEICDPLDWRMLQDEPSDDVAASNDVNTAGTDTETRTHRSLLHVLIDESTEKDQSRDTLRQITKLSNLPRLVYYERTAETVNAVQALVTVGEVDAVNCCALLDKQEGTLILKGILNEQPTLVQEKGKMKWRRKQADHDKKSDESGCDKDKLPPTSGLHIICSSTIYDDLFRQVRHWTRLGYNEKEIQRELDIRYQGIIKQSQEVYETVAEVTLQESTTGEIEEDSKHDKTQAEDTTISLEEQEKV
jgi:hypothetical protein